MSLSISLTQPHTIADEVHRMERTAELLVYANDRTSVDGLVSMLEELGHTVDLATGVAAAQGMFLQRGGHALLIVAPGVGPGDAERLLSQLRAVDPGLPIVVFGESTLRCKGPDQVHRIHGFFPGSRAGIGAIQKLLCGLPAP